MPTAEPARAVSISAPGQQTDYKDGAESPSGISPVQSDKQVFHGIEVASQLVYFGWETGREYTQNIVLKNISVKTQKIKFR
jgi:hypothetical protein